MSATEEEGEGEKNESMFKGEGLKTSLAFLGTVAAAAYAVHKAIPMIFGDEESEKDKEKEKKAGETTFGARARERSGAAGERERERGRDWGREYNDNYRWQRHPPQAQQQQQQQQQRDRRATDADVLIIEERFRARPPVERRQPPPTYDEGRRGESGMFADRRSVPANMRPRRYEFLQDDDELDEFVLHEDQVMRGQSLSNRGGSLGGPRW